MNRSHNTAYLDFIRSSIALTIRDAGEPATTFTPFYYAWLVLAHRRIVQEDAA